jgi:hypothetical protein
VNKQKLFSIDAEGVFTDKMDTEKKIEIKKWQPLPGCHYYFTVL